MGTTSVSMPDKYLEWVRSNHHNLSKILQDEIERRIKEQERIARIMKNRPAEGI